MLDRTASEGQTLQKVQQLRILMWNLLAWPGPGTTEGPAAEIVTRSQGGGATPYHRLCQEKYQHQPVVVAPPLISKLGR